MINPVEHYGLNVGLLRKGDPADFIIVDDLKSFNVLSTFIDGNSSYSKILVYPNCILFSTILNNMFTII